ncbi:hypothetical protein MATR_21710 [Marivirga tractuosa]|uniref:Lipoprotein n=1 Tax=Marivirga tractuosa (strain ATCC 23168 / DSM 4126 / NBRC 15989 / NCIMB 1408 / VKM B-1430 / H-43) TaxID=643867 RepID=E4TL75_MARTH|nr:hypothetical protein [Marivirga tractuosa]ADR20213.1 hypothetical protein Ftrac_0202 [Marivirga tractuosa DSM 4126]BDD15346.1 hypothetical protein MATR_21710 [Marivirga tractuosa]
MKNITFALLLSLLLSACLPDEPTFEDFRRAEVQRLLSNQEVKRWRLEDRLLFNEEVVFDSCEVSRQIIFNFTSAGNDKDSLFYINPADTCGNSTDTLKGFWYVPKTIKAEIPIDTVVFVWKGTDTAFFQLRDLNPKDFSISTYFKQDSLSESFTHFPLPPVEEEEEEENDDQ